MSRVVIELDDDHNIEDTVEEVLRLIREGYTSGYCPVWYIERDTE